MSRRTYQWNAFESSLNGAINTVATTITLTSTANLRFPGRLVIDPDTPASREFIEFSGISGNDLTGVTRNLAGGSLNTHGDGAIIRSIGMHQNLDDTFSDIEDLEAADASHIAADNPHTNSASDTELAATDANVAANTANIATNLTSINTNAADIIINAADIDTVEADIVAIKANVTANVVTDMQPDATFTAAAIADIYQTIKQYTLAIPTDWVTFKISVKAGGQIRNTTGSGASGTVRAIADIPETGTPLNVLTPAMGSGDSDWAVPNHATNVTGFAVGGMSQTPVPRSPSHATVTIFLGVETFDAVDFLDTWLEATAYRLS